MDDNEKLKALVLARVAQVWKESIDEDVDDVWFGDFWLWNNSGGWWDLRNGSRGNFFSIRYQIREDLPASDPVWALVAPILGIQIGK